MQLRRLAWFAIAVVVGGVACGGGGGGRAPAVAGGGGAGAASDDPAAGGAAGAAATDRGAGASVALPPGLRLPRPFVPSAYTVRLAIDPAQPQLAGRIEIEGALAAPARVVWLHAHELAVSAASAAPASGPRTPLEVVRVTPDVIAVRAPANLPAGRAVLTLEFTGAIDTAAPQGVFRAQDGGEPYVYTQFEATSARRAFPCLDEPDVKVPWQLTLEVPSGAMAVSNTPEASAAPGRTPATRAVTFRRTKPLPSYLVAFAVGGFDVVDAPPTRRGTPVRILVPRGQAAGAATARADIGPILARLEDYLGSPYPYEKLDFIAVPNFPGAMENPGLITFTQAGFLEDPRQATLAHRRQLAEVTAHELAHQWFGNMVTLRWWDDTWLNEGFATWMAAKIVGEWQPGWGGAFAALDERTRAMEADRLAAARKIRQPITTPGDIGAAFDAISYSKGASILRMFERWLGPETFQRGIRAYLAAHAWGTATAADFLAALGTAAGRDVATPFSTFLDRVGTPVVSMSLRCPASGPPVLELAQQRYRTASASSSPPPSDPPWQVPVCVRYAGAGGAQRECGLLTGATGTLALPRATGCPAWIIPNADALGYYRGALDGAQQRSLLAHLDALTPAERVGLADDVDALIGAGRLPAATALALVEPFSRDADRHVVEAAIAITTRAGALLDERLLPSYRRFIWRVFGARARALGWRNAPSDTEDTRQLRAALVGFVAQSGDDPALTAEAARLAWAWLADRTTAPLDLADRALAVTAHHNDRKLHARLVADLRRSTDGAERSRLTTILGQFSDPALIAASIALVADGTANLFESVGLFFHPAHTPAQQLAIYEAVRAHYDALVAQLPEQFRTELAGLGFVLCEPSLREPVLSFFRARLASLPAGPAAIARGLERMDACLARRSLERPGISAFFSAY